MLRCSRPLALVLAAFLAASCAPKSTAPPTQDIEATELVLRVAVEETLTALAPTATPAQSPTLTPSITPPPTSTPIPSTTPTLTITATARPTNTPKPLAVGTKGNPVPFGQTLTVESGAHTAEVTLVEVKRGQAARDQINSGQFLTYSPAEGKEFLVARFRFKCVSGPSDSLFGVDYLRFGIDANHELLGIVIVVMNDELRALLYPAGEAEGWVPFQIPAGAQVAGIEFDVDFLGTERAWFAVP